MPASPKPAVRSVSRLATPLSDRGVPTWLVYPMALFGTVYILNPTFGLFELLPDALPFVGNLDEGAAFLLMWYGLLEFFTRRRRAKEEMAESMTAAATE